MSIPLLPLSFSALSDYRNCPKQYFHKRVIKDVQDPQNEAGMWGNYVHVHFEGYLKAKIAAAAYEMPTDIPTRWVAYLDRLAAGSGKMLVECKYAVNNSLEPCGWTDPKVWMRAIIDVLHIGGDTARSVDHKTGKYKPNTDQMKLSSLLVFLHHPEIMHLKTGYFWLKEDKLTVEHFDRSEMPQMWESFIPDLQRMVKSFHAESFLPKPSGLCNGWCPVTECDFWKPKRR